MITNDDLIMYPPITAEWAKQLLFDAGITDADYSKMRIIKASPGTRYFAIPVLKTTYGDYSPVRWFPDATDFCEMYFDIETIEIKQLFDPYNNEVHRIGYGPKTNTLVFYAAGQAWESIKRTNND